SRRPGRKTGPFVYLRFMAEATRPHGRVFCVFVPIKIRQSGVWQQSVCSDDIKACHDHLPTIFHFIPVQYLPSFLPLYRLMENIIPGTY
ncbi:hypothetical protein, partial [Klebsiella electrica]|uniref:hypothetical protein n=1 Tax=Klebsiella electrica TaxID=1259973 RepID=UPI003F76C225